MKNFKHGFLFHSLFLFFITFINQFTKIFDKNNNSEIYLCKRVQTYFTIKWWSDIIILQYLLSIIMWIASANPRAWGEQLSSQLSWAAITAWLLWVDEFSPCALWSFMIGLMVVLLTLFWMMSMVLLLWGVGAILGDGYGV